MMTKFTAVLFSVAVGLVFAGSWLLLGNWAFESSGEAVVTTAYQHPDGGGVADLGSDGVSETVTHQGQTIVAAADPPGTYCSGYTFQVAMEVARERGLLDDLDVAEVRRFQREWYGATPESAERQVAFAVENAGVGHAVHPADAEAGDFVMFWRGKTGHCAVFLEWVRDDDGTIVGIKYRGSQPSAGGIADGTEYLSTSGRAGGDVDPQRIAIARLY